MCVCEVIDVCVCGKREVCMWERSLCAYWGMFVRLDILISVRGMCMYRSV